MLFLPQNCYCCFMWYPRNESKKHVYMWLFLTFPCQTSNLCTLFCHGQLTPSLCYKPRKLQEQEEPDFSVQEKPPERTHPPLGFCHDSEQNRRLDGGRADCDGNTWDSWFLFCFAGDNAGASRFLSLKFLPAFWGLTSGEATPEDSSSSFSAGSSSVTDAESMWLLDLRIHKYECICASNATLLITISDTLLTLSQANICVCFLWGARWIFWFLLSVCGKSKHSKWSTQKANTYICFESVRSVSWIWHSLTQMLCTPPPNQDVSVSCIAS